MTDGIYPHAVWRPTKNFGYPQGTRGQLAEADCITDHIMAGWKATLDNAAWREPAGVGVHFGIGRDGSVSQYINLFDASHGHGVSGSKAKYDRGNRHLAAWERRAGAQWIQVPYAGTIAFALIEPSSVDSRYTQSIPNCRAVAKEHEGFPHDRPGFDATWPAAMVRASRDVDEWVMEEFWRVKRWEMKPDPDMKIGHFQIDAVNRASCPGPEWPKAAMLATLQKEDDMPLNDDDKAWIEDKINSAAGIGNPGFMLGDPDETDYKKAANLPAWFKRHIEGEVTPRLDAIDKKLAAAGGAAGVSAAAVVALIAERLAG